MYVLHWKEFGPEIYALAMRGGGDGDFLSACKCRGMYRVFAVGIIAILLTVLRVVCLCELLLGLKLFR